MYILYKYSLYLIVITIANYCLVMPNSSGDIRISIPSSSKIDQHDNHTKTYLSNTGKNLRNNVKFLHT